MNEEKYTGRLLRLFFVKQQVAAGIFSKEDAVEILQGCLSPDDESTRVDDSGLLEASSEYAYQKILDEEKAANERTK